MTAVSLGSSSSTLTDLAFLAAAGYNDNFTAQGATLEARMTAAGWTLLNGSSLAPTSGQFATSGANQGYYVHSNAAGFVAEKDGALAIVFRGSDDNQDFFDAVFNQDGHYALLEPLVLAALDYAQAEGLDTVYIAGHSLGGAMAEWFAAAANAYAASAGITFVVGTFGSPGTNGAPTPASPLAYEAVNFQHSEDAIPGLNFHHNGPVVTVERDGGDQHSSLLYYDTLARIGASPLGNVFAANPGDYFVALGSGGIDRFPADLANQDPSRALFAMGLSGNDTLVGTSRSDLLDGGIGDDTLDGGSGADSLAGGLGDDSYVVDDAGDVILEAVGGGGDTVRTRLSSYALGANLEHLAYLGAAAFIGTGNALANSLSGGSGADLLYGGSGADTLVGGSGSDTLVGGSGLDLLYGGSGDDTYVVSEAGDVAVDFGAAGDRDVLLQAGQSLVLQSSIEVLYLLEGAQSRADGNDLGNTLISLTAAAVFFGHDGGDSLIGGGLDDSLFGDSGADFLQGNGGADSLFGGLGDDIIDAGDGADTAFGGGGLDLLVGLGGDDKLWGGSGNDSLIGGAGEDWLYGDSGADLLSGRVDRDRVFGGSGDDTLWGDNGNDTVIGDSGQDLLYGGYDRDSLFGGDGDDVVYGDGHGDYLAGAQGNDTLFGGLGPDWLNGNDGDDTLDGGAGQDTLRGRSGADVFVVDSQPNPRDQVTDFSLAEGDRLDLSRLIPGASGDLYASGTMRLIDVTISGVDYLEVQIDSNGGGDNFQRAILLQDVTANQLSGTEFYFT